MASTKFDLTPQSKFIDIKSLLQEIDDIIEEKVESLRNRLQPRVEVKERIIEKLTEPEIKIDESELKLKIKTSNGWSDWIELKPVIREYVKEFVKANVSLISVDLREKFETLLTNKIEEKFKEVSDVLLQLVEETLQTKVDAYNEFKEKIQEDIEKTVFRILESLNQKLHEKISYFSDQIYELAQSIDEKFEHAYKELSEKIKEQKGPKGDPGLPGPPPKIEIQESKVIFKTQFQTEEFDFKPIEESIYSSLRKTFESEIELLEENLFTLEGQFLESTEKLSAKDEEILENIKSLSSELKLLKESAEQIEENVQDISKTFERRIKILEESYRGFSKELEKIEEKIEEHKKLFEEVQQQPVQIQEQTAPNYELAAEGSIIGFKQNGQWVQWVDLSKYVTSYGGSGLGPHDLEVLVDAGEIRTIKIEDPNGSQEIVHSIVFESPNFSVSYENGKAIVSIEPWSDEEGNWRTEEIIITHDGQNTVLTRYPIKPGYHRVYWNGVKLKPGRSNDYIVEENKIIFNPEIHLMIDDIITVEYIRS